MTKLTNYSVPSQPNYWYKFKHPRAGRSSSKG